MYMSCSLKYDRAPSKLLHIPFDFRRKYLILGPSKSQASHKYFSPSFLEFLHNAFLDEDSEDSDPSGMAAQMPPSVLEEFFDTSRAIFTPFTGFSFDTQPSADPNKIVENVMAQQAVVRGQIISMIESRAKALVSKAEADAAVLGPGRSDDGELLAAEIEKKKQENDDLIKRLRVKMKPNSDPKEYMYRSVVKFAPEGTSGKDADGDTIMDDSTSLSMPRRSTPQQIWTRLGVALQALTDQGVAELDGYDKHAEKVLRGLRTRYGNPQPSPIVAAAPPGILKKRNEMSLVDISMSMHQDPKINVRRTSTGMPVSFSPMGPPEKRRESIEELVRRGSR